MAMAIATEPLAQALIPRLQRYLDQYMGRFQIHRVCAHATVIHDETAFKRLLAGRDRLADQAALDWQADQCDDPQEGDVFHHLQQQVVTSPLLSKVISRTERTTSTTTLVASAMSPSFRSRTNGRPVSSFGRKSLRCSCLQRNHVIAHAFAYSSAIPDVFPNAGKHWAWVYFPEQGLKIVWENQTGYKPFVVWNLQLDVVDLDSKITTYTRPEKRLRTAGSLFLRAMEFEAAAAAAAAAAAGHGNCDPIPSGRKFRGVRHRPDRKRWVAEMKPPKSKNKVSFGDFKTELQAARAVDAAFYHFGKPHLLNFPDTPRILASKPRGHGLDEKAKLKLVKQQGKWLASIATALASNSAPSNSASSNSASSNSAPDSGCSAVGLSQFRSFSEISSFPSSSSGGVDEDADDGTSYEDNPGGIIPWSSGLSAQGFPGTSMDTHPNGNGISQLECAAAEVGVIPCIPSAGNSMESYPEFSTGRLRRSMNSSWSCMEFLVMSPPRPRLYLATSSSSDSQGSVTAGHLWEPQSFGCI